MTFDSICLYQQENTVDLPNIWKELPDVVQDRVRISPHSSPMEITLDVIQIYCGENRSYNAVIHHSAISWAIYGKVYEIIFGKPLDRVMTTTPVRIMYGE